MSSSGSNQALVIDGSAIVLQATTTPGTTADNGYTYSVSVSGDSTTITLSIASSGTDAGYTAAGAASLIDGIAYRTLDDTVESGTVTVTLESLSDDGGDTAQLGISSTIAITSNINVAPVIADNGALEAAESFTIDDLGDSTEVVYSSDGSYAYAAGDGAISVFSVDDTGRLTLAQTLTGITDLGSVSEMAISADGRSIYAIDGGGSVYVFSVADDGALSFVSAVDTGNGDASGGLAISEDGAWVYVGTQWNGVARFSRDLSTGALTYVDRVPGEDGSIYSNSRNGVIATAGDYLYVIYTSGSHAILVYQLNDDGTLSTVATLLTGDSGYSAVDYSLAVSDDGQNLYVANPDTGGVAIYQFSGSALTRLSTLTVDGVASIALSDDGSQLYAAAYDGTIGIYTVAGNGTLTLSGSLAGGTGGSDIAVSGDGLSILVAGGGVSRYSGAQTLVLGEALTFAGGLTLKDSNYDALSGGAGNYNGASLSVSASVEGGSFGFADGGGLSYANGVISLDGSAIATLGVSGGVLSVTFTADASTAVANQVLRQLTYSNASATAGSFIQLSVIASDAALAGSAVALTLRVNAVPQVNTDAATGYVLDGATSETAYSFTLFAGLFGDADGDNLNWSVDGLPDGLTFDAATRTISGAATETGAFSLTVTVTDASGPRLLWRWIWRSSRSPTAPRRLMKTPRPPWIRLPRTGSIAPRWI